MTSHKADKCVVKKNGKHHANLVEDNDNIVVVVLEVNAVGNSDE